VATEVDVDKAYRLAKFPAESWPTRVSLFTFKVVERRGRGIARSHSSHGKVEFLLSWREYVVGVLLFETHLDSGEKA
jgi:hypothetical protein